MCIIRKSGWYINQTSRRDKFSEQIHPSFICGYVLNLVVGPSRYRLRCTQPFGFVGEGDLCHSSTSTKRHIQRISNCTIGVVFLGTPHSGFGLAKWANFGASLTLGNTKIVVVLRPDSEILARGQQT
jgi:hypothetical protein